MNGTRTRTRTRSSFLAARKWIRCTLRHQWIGLLCENEHRISRVLRFCVRGVNGCSNMIKKTHGLQTASSATCSGIFSRPEKKNTI